VHKQASDHLKDQARGKECPWVSQWRRKIILAYVSPLLFCVDSVRVRRASELSVSCKECKNIFFETNVVNVTVYVPLLRCESVCDPNFFSLLLLLALLSLRLNSSLPRDRSLPELPNMFLCNLPLPTKTIENICVCQIYLTIEDYLKPTCYR